MASSYKLDDDEYSAEQAEAIRSMNWFSMASPHVLHPNSPLSPSARLVYVAMGFYASGVDRKNVRPSIATLCGHTGLGKDAVIAARKELERYGVAEVVARPKVANKGDKGVRNAPVRYRLVDTDAHRERLWNDDDEWIGGTEVVGSADKGVVVSADNPLSAQQTTGCRTSREGVVGSADRISTNHQDQGIRTTDQDQVAVAPSKASASAGQSSSARKATPPSVDDPWDLPADHDAGPVLAAYLKLLDDLNHPPAPRDSVALVGMLMERTENHGVAGGLDLVAHLAATCRQPWNPNVLDTFVRRTIPRREQPTEGEQRKSQPSMPRSAPCATPEFRRSSAPSPVPAAPCDSLAALNARSRSLAGPVTTAWTYERLSEGKRNARICFEEGPELVEHLGRESVLAQTGWSDNELDQVLASTR